MLYLESVMGVVLTLEENVEAGSRKIGKVTLKECVKGPRSAGRSACGLGEFLHRGNKCERQRSMSAGFNFSVPVGKYTGWYVTLLDFLAGWTFHDREEGRATYLRGGKIESAHQAISTLLRYQRRRLPQRAPTLSSNLTAKSCNVSSEGLNYKLILTLSPAAGHGPSMSAQSRSGSKRAVLYDLHRQKAKKSRKMSGGFARPSSHGSMR